jgi:cardiolipin synthase
MPDGGELARPAGYGFVTLPNVITFARLCAVPMAVWLVMQGYFTTAFWLFAGAGASDAVDGWLARRRGTSFVGALLDPVADKALLMTMYVTLAAVHVLPDWLAILVVFRDAVILGGVAVLALLGQPLMIRPLMISKVNTALQFVLVAVALLLAGMGLEEPLMMWALTWAVAASTFTSGAAYVWKVARP